jgi:RimJ/RimL family protein N-acetyltransferase
MAAVSARPLADLSPHAQAAFYTWIEGMTRAEDWEDGPGFADWLRHHAAIPGDTTWVFADPATGDIVATASLVAQDRDLEAPPGGWVLGGVNVARQQRGRGYGHAVMAWIDAELCRRASVSGRRVGVVLQAENPAAVRLYCAFGFHALPDAAGVYGKMYAS